MIKVGEESFYPPQSKLDFWPITTQTPKISVKLNHIGLSSKFQESLVPTNDHGSLRGDFLSAAGLFQRNPKIAFGALVTK